MSYDSAERLLWLHFRKARQDSADTERAASKAMRAYVEEIKSIARINHALQSTLERRCDEIEAAGVRLELEDV